MPMEYFKLLPSNSVIKYWTWIFGYLITFHWFSAFSLLDFIMLDFLFCKPLTVALVTCFVLAVPRLPCVTPFKGCCRWVVDHDFYPVHRCFVRRFPQWRRLGRPLGSVRSKLRWINRQMISTRSWWRATRIMSLVSMNGVTALTVKSEVSGYLKGVNIK